MLNFIDGKKTYIAALASAVYSVLIAFNVVPSEIFIWGLIGAFGLYGLKGAFKKLEVRG